MKDQLTEPFAEKSEHISDSISLVRRVLRLPQGWCCLAVTALSFLLLQTVGKRPTLLWADASYYWYLSRVFRLSDPVSWYDPLRTYGYPVYLKLVGGPLEFLGFGVHIVRVVTLIEFALHTLLAALGAATFARLSRGRFDQSARYWGAALCFTLVQLDIAMLGATQDILTYHIAAILIGLLFWSFLSAAHWFWRGLWLALAIVVRPFHFNWAIGLALVLLLLSAFLHWPWPWRWPEYQALLAAVRSLVTAYGRKLLYFCLPLIVLVGWQFLLIYRAEGQFRIVGAAAMSALQLHKDLRVYTLRYDTYSGNDPQFNPAVPYNSARNKAIIERCNEFRISLSDCIWRDERNWVYVPETILIKTTGMFQNFDWSTYRGKLDNRPNTLFWQGWVVFLLFLYVPLDYLRRLWARAHLAFYEHLVVLGCVAYVLAYGIFTAPQTDYIFPVHQPLLVFGVLYLAERLHNRKEVAWLIVVASLGSAIYWYSYVQILAALFQAYPQLRAVH